MTFESLSEPLKNLNSNPDEAAALNTFKAAALKAIDSNTPSPKTIRYMKDLMTYLQANKYIIDSNISELLNNISDNNFKLRITRIINEIFAEKYTDLCIENINKNIPGTLKFEASISNENDPYTRVTRRIRDLQLMYTQLLEFKIDPTIISIYTNALLKDQWQQLLKQDPLANKFRIINVAVTNDLALCPLEKREAAARQIATALRNLGLYTEATAKNLLVCVKRLNIEDLSWLYVDPTSATPSPILSSTASTRSSTSSVYLSAHSTPILTNTELSNIETQVIQNKQLELNQALESEITQLKLNEASLQQQTQQRQQLIATKTARSKQLQILIEEQQQNTKKRQTHTVVYENIDLNNEQSKLDGLREAHQTRASILYCATLNYTTLQKSALRKQTLGAVICIFTLCIPLFYFWYKASKYNNVPDNFSAFGHALERCGIWRFNEMATRLTTFREVGPAQAEVNAIQTKVEAQEQHVNELRLQQAEIAADQATAQNIAEKTSLDKTIADLESTQQKDLATLELTKKTISEKSTTLLQPTAVQTQTSPRLIPKNI